jgi:DNA-binding NarL/FixJ family response regulator
MPECHRCPYNGKHSKACLKCKGPADTNHKGKSFVSIDSGDGQTLGEVEASARISVFSHEDVRSRMPRVHPDAVRVAVAFLSLTQSDFELVQALLGGKNMSDVSRDVGLTRAAISAQVKRLVRKHPVFAFLRR